MRGKVLSVLMGAVAVFALLAVPATSLPGEDETMRRT
jgi:hypothetical protein